MNCRNGKKIVFEGANIGIDDKLRGKRRWMKRQSDSPMKKSVSSSRGITRIEFESVIRWGGGFRPNTWLHVPNREQWDDTKPTLWPF